MRTIEEILGSDLTLDSLNVIGSQDPAFWIERVLGFVIEPFHREWIDMFINYDKVILIAPTGHGKSQVFGVGIPLWIAWFQRNKEILIISNTDEQAKKLLERIVAEMEDNELVKQILPEKFGDVVWNKKEINTTTKVKIFSRPYNINVRGYHVDYCICDEMSQYKDHSIFERYVFTRVTSKGGKLVGITTPLNAVDLPNKYLARYNKEVEDGKKPTFIVRVYKAIIDGLPIFPQRLDAHGAPVGYSLERLNEIKETMGSIRFEQEYMCNVLALEDSIFPPELVFDCFDEGIDFEDKGTGGKTYIGADFAVGTGKDADYTVFTIIEALGAKYYIRKIERYKGMPISSQINRLEELNRVYRPSNIYIDESNFGVSVLQELRQRQIRVVGCKFDFASRNKYLMNLRKILEDHLLVIPRGLHSMNLTDELYLETTSFTVAKLPSGVVSYKSNAAHDDMTMSLCLALSGFRADAPTISQVLYGGSIVRRGII